MTREINIPVPGFYESWLDHGLDRAVEELAEGMAEEHDLSASEIAGIIFDSANWGKAHDILARAYAEEYDNFLCEEYDLNLGLEFSIMTSPREYNFTTDRVFCTISRDAVAQLYRAVNKADLTAAAREQFTSRSGFISFYDPDWRTWGKLSEWDYNQLGTLLHALHRDRGEGEVMWAIEERLSDDFYGALEQCVNWDRVEGAIKERLMIEAGEIEEDAREFPHGVTDVAEYVKKFDKLNHLKGV